MQNNVSTKRRKLVLSILIAAVAALGIFVFAACSDDVDVLKDYPITVTYDFQGGMVNSKGSVDVRVKENSKIPALHEGKGGQSAPTKSGYSFKGFYLAETDEDGNVVRDDDGNISVTDTEWDFANDRVADKNITICAKYWDNYKVVLNYGDNSSLEGDIDYSLKTEIDLSRKIDGSPNVLTSDTLKVAGYTFESYNLTKDSNAAATALKDFPYTFANSVFVDNKVNVWGKSLKGQYQLVKEASDLFFSSDSDTTNYYLLNDINLKGKEYKDEDAYYKLPKYYSGKFIGNGHTISNFTLNLSATDPSYNCFGLFRTLEKGAEIRNVTFSNVTLSYKLNQSTVQRYYVGMLAGQCETGVVIEGVNISSSQQDGNTFEYMIGEGVTNESLVIAEDLLIAEKNASVVLKDCNVSGVKRVPSATIITEDKEYMLYVKYTDMDGQITFDEGAIYDLALKDPDGDTYSTVRIEDLSRTDSNTFELTRLGGEVYVVQFTVNSGEISATMIKK